jgi:hypothetical protein
MKKSKVWLIAIMAFVLGATTIGAATKIETIKATINPALNIVLNGKAFVPTDMNGKTLRPITYNNTTYIPLRSVGNAFNVPVNYVSATSTIELGTKAVEVDLIRANAFSNTWGYANYASIDPDKLYINNKKFKNGVINEFKRKSESHSFVIKLNKNYTTLTFDLVSIEADHTYKVMVTDKNNISLKETLIDGLENQSVSVDVTGVEQVEFSIKFNGDTFVGPDTVVVGNIFAK